MIRDFFVPDRDALPGYRRSLAEACQTRMEQLGMIERKNAPCNLYVMATAVNHGMTFVKVGIADNVGRRLPGVQTGCPLQIEAVKYVQMITRAVAVSAEALMHRHLEPFHTVGEWFQFELDRPEHKEAFRLACDTVINSHAPAGWKWSVIDSPNR